MPSGPKSNKYTNRHAAEANERKQEQSLAEKRANEKAKEDARWAITDKRDLKRAELEQEQAQREAEKARRDAEKKEQLEMEERAATKAPSKVSKRQLQKELAKMCKEYDKERDAIRGSVSQDDATALPLSNPNQEARHEGSEERVTASGSAGDVLKQLQVTEKSGEDSSINDRNIGKRARVLYRSFYDEHLEKVKEEQPGLRRTQYHNIMWDMWQKSPANPFALRKEKMSLERLEMERRWIQGEEDDAENPAEE